MALERALVKWTKKYTQYNPEDAPFVLAGPSLQEYLKSGEIEVVSEDVVETASNEPQAEKADSPTAKKK